jgi:hypothetical protein
MMPRRGLLAARRVHLTEALDLDGPAMRRYASRGLVRAMLLVVALGISACSEPGLPAGTIVFTRASYSCEASGRTWGFTAYLREPAEDDRLNLEFESVAGGGTLEERDIPTDPSAIQIAVGPEDIKSFCLPPFGVGTYRATLARPGAIGATLATGTFEVLP